jgi:hypothetical protein
VHLLREAEVLAVEGNRLVDIVDDVTHADTRHDTLSLPLRNPNVSHSSWLEVKAASRDAPSDASSAALCKLS